MLESNGECLDIHRWQQEPLDIACRRADECRQVDPLVLAFHGRRWPFADQCPHAAARGHEA